MTAFQDVTAVCIVGAFAFGIILVMLVSLRPALGKRLNLSEAGVDWLVGSFHLALIPMMLVSGLAVDHLGARPITIAGSIISSVALFMLAQGAKHATAQGAILLLGAGGAFLSTSSIILMRAAFNTSNEAASQNLGNVFFGLGALLAPALTQILVERLGFRPALKFLAVVLLIPALIAGLTQSGAFPTEDAADSLANVLTSGPVLIAGLAFLLYGPLEGSLGFWATRYLTGIGFRERAADWLVTAFWLAFLSARLGMGLAQRNGVPRFPPQAGFIVIFSIAAAAALGNLVGARTRVSAAVGLLLVGACLGPIFPTLVGMLLDSFQQQRGTAYGAMFSIGATGSLFLPPMIGVYARRSTLQRAMRIPMILALLLALVGFVLTLYA
jgi:fucose permease